MRENLPNYEDLTGSVSALLRLQDTYKLETNELARGNVGGVASPELTGKIGLIKHAIIKDKLCDSLSIITC
jgi:hypothetical protein